MKKLAFILSLFLLILTGCSKEECYSCDPEIDSWIKENYTEIQKYTREKISSYPLSYEKAILRALTAERRKEIWSEKIDYIKSMKWSNEEIAYINYFVNSFNKLDYSYKKSDQNSLIEEEMYLKLVESMEKFNWDKKFVFETFFLVGDIGALKFNLKEEQVDGGKCECKYDLGCPGWGDCVHGMCEETSDGCGLFGGAPCTGKC